MVAVARGCNLVDQRRRAGVSFIMLAAVVWQNLLFWGFGLTASALAIGVVVSTNVVRMAVCLVMSLAAVAGLFFLAGAPFLGAIQILVYVGGTMVLLVFGVMLTARLPSSSMRTNAGQWVAAIIVGAALLAVCWQACRGLAGVCTRADAKEHSAAKADHAGRTTTEFGLALLGVRTDAARPNGGVPLGGQGYLLPFELISVHLLAALVGAAYLARSRWNSRQNDHKRE